MEQPNVEQPNVEQRKQAVISSGKFIGLTIVIFAAPLLAWLLLLPYFLGFLADSQRRRMQHAITILLGVVIIFFATSVVTLLPYSLARPLAKLKISTLNRFSRSLNELGTPLEPLIQSVAPSDRAAYAGFLRQPGTGIIRLGGEYPFGSTFYDFLQNKPEGDRDIRLNDGRFEVGFAGRDAGLFVELGTGDLAAIDLVHPRIQALMTLAPPVQEFYDRARSLEENEQATIDGAYYDRTIKAKTAMVYGLRSIMPSDERDIVVVLKAVRQDSDGSLIVAWKLLADFSGP